MDEIHLSTHTTAGHHTWLLQRLRQIIPQARFLEFPPPLQGPAFTSHRFGSISHEEAIGLPC